MKEKKEQEDLEEAKRLQAEKLRTEKLLQMKLPPPLLTKSAEIQKEKVLNVVVIHIKISVSLVC